MRLTQKLKDFAVSSGWAAAGAADDVIEKAVGTKMASGELSAERFAELTKEKSKGARDLIQGMIKSAVDEAVKSTAPTPSYSTSSKADGRIAGRMPSPSPDKAFAGAASEFADRNIEVKSIAERYDDSRKALIYPSHNIMSGRKHALAGQRVRRGYLDTSMDELSERDKAIAGAWFKASLYKHSHNDPDSYLWKPTEEDRALIDYAIEHKEWSGPIGPHSEDRDSEQDNRYVYEGEKLHGEHKRWIKTLLDDSSSGGINITPQVFDDAVILIPVLYGELYPFVNVVPVTRGRRVLGGIMQNPTISWGTAEGTAVTPFSTANFVTSFNNTIYPAVSAIQIGLDFLEDTPVNVTQTIIDRYGLKMMEQLDYVIALGDGVTQPTGIFTAAGTTAVSADNATAGPPTVSDYEQLLFAVPKQYRQEPGAKPAFLANETTYQRARGIQVDITDQRRVFGLNETDYSLLQYPYKIQASLNNYQAAFCMLNRYRMYRRLGMIVRVETLGYQLSLTNTKLIVIRARYGGAPELGAAFAVSTNMQN